MSTPRPSAHHAFTLIEMLAVIVIIAMATGAILLNVGAVDGHTRANQFAHELRQLDRAARQLARIEGAATLDLHEGAKRIVLLQPTATDVGEVIREMHLPTWIEMQLRDGSSQPVDRVVYDPAGRSMDLVIHLRGNDHQIQYQVHGLTGAWE